MAKPFKWLLDLFTYKEPQNQELGFELLEDENEGSASTSTKKASSSNMNDQDMKKEEDMHGSRVPIPLDNWNAVRRSEGSRNQDPGLRSKEEAVSSCLSVNRDIISDKFYLPKNKDVNIRELAVGRKIKAFMVYLDGMIDKKILNLAVLPALMEPAVFTDNTEDSPVDYLMNNILSVHGVMKHNRYAPILEQILNGSVALFMDGFAECILVELKGYEKRNVEAPKTENVVKGSQEGFTENLRTNLTLVRRIIRSEKLITEIVPMGKSNKTKCALLYIEGLTDSRIVEEARKRLGCINTDFILGDGMVEQFIEDQSFNLFPQVINSERPDRTASFLVEGQVVLIVDGTPFSMAVPVTFFRLLHTSEDAMTRWPFGTFLRLIRVFGLFCATLLPGLYIATVMFHPDVIPTELLTSITQAREAVPFPSVLEVLIMEMSFELIREGGIRVPVVIGQTLGIVGALILGQAAVSAGLVSPLLVIIVSITALGSFAIPNYNLSLAIRIERFIFVGAGAFLGYYGIALVFFLLASLACSMKSFGVPFMAPIAPRTKINPDVILRGHAWKQNSRPDGFQASRKRQKKV